MKRQRQGFVLLTVLIIVLLGSMTAVSLLFAIRADATAQVATAQADQAWAAALSGLCRAIAIAESSVRSIPLWEENSAAFQHQWVSDDGVNEWHFSVWTDRGVEDRPVVFGLSDEASRLNVQTAPADWLAALPTARQDDAANAGLPPESGLFSDPDAADAGPAPASASPSAWGPHLTAYSYEPNVDARGRPRVNVNDAGIGLAGLDLPDTTREYLEALRNAGQTVTNVADLLEARTTVLDRDRGREIEVVSGVGREELALVLDRCTTTNAPLLRGLINVNTAPAAVLAVLPGLDVSLADSIVATRRVLAPEERSTIAWLYERNVLSVEQFRQAAPHLTARSFQFRFYCVGYGLPAGRSRVVEAIIDVAARPSRIVWLRDLSRHGFPLPLDWLETEERQARLINHAPPDRRWLASGGRAFVD